MIVGMAIQKQQCAINDCNRKGTYELIPSINGWFCKRHQRELWESNYPDLIGDNVHNLTMGQMYSAITCKVCDHDPPRGNCKYEKIGDTWYYIGSEHEKAGILKRLGEYATNKKLIT